MSWMYHIYFAVSYAVTVLVMVSMPTVTDPFYSTIWPAAGIAVWWAVKSSSKAEVAFVSVFVFVSCFLIFHLQAGRSVESALLTGVSHWMSGPLVRLFMKVGDWIKWEKTWNSSTPLSPIDQIAKPGDVYRLLLASIVAVSISKMVALWRIELEGGVVMMATFSSLFLRDIAGIIAVAGAGLAIFTATAWTVNPKKIAELVLIVALTGVLFYFVFGGGRVLPVVYILLLPLYWSATRLEIPLAAWHAVITAFLATIFGYGDGGRAFAASEDPLVQVVAIRLFIVMCLLLTLVVATTIRQRSRLAADLEALVSTIPDALLTVDRSGKAMPINEAAENVLDIGPNRWVSLSCEPVVG